MKPLREQTLARRSPVCCHVTASAVVRLSVESLPELRRNPGSFGGRVLPASFLKHADEQTVAGLAAVYQSIQRFHLTSVSFQDWGVLAAPRFLGRPAMAAALQRFMAEGAWGVSPHLIPHRSLHSISGTVSQALQVRGPNYGVGGGPNAPAEALLAAMAMLTCKSLPGVWVVMTCLDPELPPDDSGRIAPSTQCVGIALALSLSPADGSALRLRVLTEAATSVLTKPASDSEVNRSADDLARLEQALNLPQTRNGEKPESVLLESAGCRIEISRPAHNETNGYGSLMHGENGAVRGMLMSANGAERR